MKRVVGWFLAISVVMFALISRSSRGVRAQDNPATVEFYKTKVQPVFQSNCYRCHGGMNRRGGLSIQNKAGMMKGGKNGAVLVPGHPEQSLLVKLIRHEGPANNPMAMPPKGKLSDADIVRVEQWIRAGAIMPDSANGR